MELEEYLELMMEWQEERFQGYLEYCEECMLGVYQAWLQNGYKDNRKLTFEEFKSEYDTFRKLGQAQNVYYKACPEYDTCAEYQVVKEVDDYSDYFECQEMYTNNGQQVYVGPHCAEDGMTITLAVFSDENCYEYIGNGVDISKVMQVDWDIEEDVLKPYYNSAYGPTLEQLEYLNEENVCIPCRYAVRVVHTVVMNICNLFLTHELNTP